MEHPAETVGRELKAWQAMGSSFGHFIPYLKFQWKANVLIQQLPLQQSWDLQDAHSFLHHSYGLGGDEGNVTRDMDVLSILPHLPQPLTIVASRNQSGYSSAIHSST